MCMVWNIFHNWVSNHEIPSRIRVLFKDLIAFRKKASGGMVFEADVDRKSKEHSGFMKVHYHNYNDWFASNTEQQVCYRCDTPIFEKQGASYG